MSDSKVRKWTRKFKDERTTVHDEKRSEVSQSVVYKIVTENLNFKQFCSQWVPKLLTAEHKEKKFTIPLDYFDSLESERDGVLSRIVTGDVIWVSNITPESRQQSLKWRHTSPVTVKAKQTLSQRTVMATVFCGVLPENLMPQGAAINSDVLTTKK
ncbi:histone-lysine N-methyltransferase SETMAR [Trichonephila clavipes]|nr:histone-lysine N-methyltransferase SETMAR [Trichonephila clavipes]